MANKLGAEKPKATRNGHLRLFELLKSCRAGQVLSARQILDVTKWADESLGTYLKKNKISPFLRPHGIDEYLVLVNGNELTCEYFVAVFTQKNPAKFVPSTEMKLFGLHHQYRLVEKIGAGAVAQVWKCSTSSGADEGTLFAAKIMVPSPDLILQGKLDDIKERFLREGENGYLLKHPRIIGITDYGTSDDETRTPFIIMKLAENSVRAQLEATDRGFSVAQSATIVAACAEGLDYLHEKNCIHRDLKPDNVLFEGGEFRIGDLGIVTWSDLNPDFTRAGTMTRNSMILGSYHYMPPEQARRNDRPVCQSDIYALGVTWLEMLLGDAPHPSEIGYKEYEQPTDRPDVNTFIDSMLRYDPNKRPLPRDVAAFARALM